MFNTAARKYENSALESDRDTALRQAFANRSDAGYARAHILHDSRDSGADQATDGHDGYEIAGPKLAGDSLAGKIAQIKSLIESHNSAAAIELALDLFAESDNLSYEQAGQITEQITEALQFVNLDHGYDVEKALKLRLITESGIATHWDADVLDLSAQGFESVLQNIRVMNSSSARLPEDLGLVHRVPSAA